MMRPEFQRDLWGLAIGSAALAAVVLSGALHKAGVPGRDVIGVAITFAVATSFTLGIGELLDRLGLQSVQHGAANKPRSPEATDKAAPQPIEPASQREQQGHANDQGGAPERYHDD
jgi:hypothetical protein